MISTKVDSETRERYVQNIIRTLDAANADQYRRGMEWYRTAHQLADMMAEGNTVAGAGVLAALSANKSWTENTRLAAQAFLTGKPSGHVGDAITKAARIMAGEDPTTVLPMASKTGQFFRCILDPTDPDAVVIDRHAHDIAVGERYGNRDRGLSSKGRYALLAHCYREAAMRVNLLPQEVQAITWVVQVESK